ncbi:MAG: flavin reductase family protein [Armatimonadetes bacterium]|nr:flavin reductase family protein [Armatimonadota bacterium]
MPRLVWRLADESPSFAYDLLSNLVVPRPIAFVSTLSGTGEANLAPFSFFMLGGAKPPSLAFCPVRGKDGRKKATLTNVEETGEFVVNLVDRDMAEGMNQTAVDAAKRGSKWGIGGFTAVESSVVRPGRVAESPAALECRCVHLFEHGDAAFVIGEVLAVDLSSDVWDAETRKPTGFRPIARLGGSGYLDLAGGKLFEMSRPKADASPSVDL